MGDDKKPITVGEFMKRCEQRGRPAYRDYGETELVVRRHQLSGGMGGQPVFHVVGLYDGFDWDDGKLFLELDFPVQAADAEFERERSVSRELSETIGFLYLALTHKHATAEQKLDAVVRTLRARTGMKLKDCIPGEMPDVMTSVRKVVEDEMAKRPQRASKRG